MITFRPPRLHGVRRERDEERNTIWTVPDYENGRSRSLAIERAVLRDFGADHIIEALTNAYWEKRIEAEDVLVRRTHDRTLEVVAWIAPPSEKWFWSPEQEQWFMAFQSSSGGISTGAPPPPIRHFVAIHGKTFTAVGPKGIRDVTELEFDEIKQYLPKRS